MALPPYAWVRPLLFRLPPRQAQRLADGFLRHASSRPRALRHLRRQFAVEDPRLRRKALGTEFPNPVGAAAGVDKDASIFPALLALGFGFAEVGTVTPKPQGPNPGRTLWRSVPDLALVNWLGFPSAGAEAVLARLEGAAQLRRHGKVPEAPVGLNLGPNRDNLEGFETELGALLPRLAPHADYVVMNLSSPNTKGLRALQTPEGVRGLVGRCRGLLDDSRLRVPVLLKLSPDSDLDAVREVCHAAMDAGAGGIVATNSTTSRPPHLAHLERGGLSGAPLRERADRVLEKAAKALEGEGTLVGVGGIMTGADAARKMMLGATLVQAYTGFVYRGPGFPGLVCRELLAVLEASGLDKVDELVEARPKRVKLEAGRPAKGV